MPHPGDPLLSITDLTVRFGGVTALTSVDLDVFPGEILALVGPNGAGKTSLLNAVSGLYRPARGTVRFRDAAGSWHPLHRRRSHQIARLGIGRMFQNIELFRHMTVLENLMLGRHVHMRGNVLSCALYRGRQAAEEVRHRTRVEEVIDFLNLQAVRHHPVGTLAYGRQKLVELGRALALEPRLLLLDEPLAGMNSEEKEQLARFVLDVHEEWGITQLVIDHDMDVVMDIATRVAVLDFGKKIADGPPDEVQRNPAVIRAYLGEAEQRAS